MVNTTPQYKVKRLRASAMIVFILGFFVGLPLGNIIGAGQTAARAHLLIAYGSEKATWMGELQVRFTQWWEDTYPDFPIKTEFQAYGSAQSMVGILNGEIKPIIWSPAASIWVPIFNARWRAQTSGQTIINQTVKVIYSPVVIATWESFNQTYNIKGLNSLYNLIQQHPGVVKLAHTDPTLSNSGFMAVVMEIAAMLGKDSAHLTMADLTNSSLQKWLREFESAAVQYGESTGFLGKMFINRGPASLNIAILYENVVKDITNKYPGEKVIAIYPEEGSLFSDHPFCALNASWVTPDDQFVAAKFLEFIQRPDMAQLAMKNGFRPIDPSIPLDTDIFNYQKSGLAPVIPCRELGVPLDGEVLARVPDVWALTRSVI